MRLNTFKIYTFGCKVNQYESQLIRENLLEAEFKEEDDAFYHIVNTCCVTQHTENKVRKLIRHLRRLYPSSRIIVCGCLVELDRNIEGADILVSNKEKEQIHRILGLHSQRRDKITFFKNRSRAFVKVQEGCRNRCSYCVIPFTRYSIHSKPVKNVLEEVLILESKGYKEIVICGTNLGEYGKDIGVDLISLLDILCKNYSGRIRLSSLEPKYITDPLIHFMKEHNKICPHLHIPFQSGDDKILSLMNRGYSRQFLEDLISKIRKNIHSISITTDIIVGFPQEEEQNFLNTISLIEKIRPLKVHIFSFSPRKFTLASQLKGKVCPQVIRKRRERLEEICRRISLEVRRNFLGEELEGIVENKKGDYFDILTSNYLRVKVNSASLNLKDLVRVKIRSIKEGDLFGEVVGGIQ